MLLLWTFRLPINFCFYNYFFFKKSTIISFACKSTQSRRMSVSRKLYYSNVWNSIYTGWNQHFNFVIVFISKKNLKKAKRTTDYNSVLIPDNAPGTRNKSVITSGENWDTLRSDTLLHNLSSLLDVSWNT